MPRYIDADAFVQAEIERCGSQPVVGTCTMDNEYLSIRIAAAPTLSPDEVRGVGKWIMLENQSKEDTDNGNYWYTCSHCSAGDLHAKVQEVPFCWKCGARMKGD